MTFKDVAKKLVYINDSDINTFKITLTDGQGLVTDYTFNIKVNKADVQVASINNYDMWAHG